MRLWRLVQRVAALMASAGVLFVNAASWMRQFPLGGGDALTGGADLGVVGFVTVTGATTAVALAWASNAAAKALPRVRWARGTNLSISARLTAAAGMPDAEARSIMA